MRVFTFFPFSTVSRCRHYCRQRSQSRCLETLYDISWKKNLEREEEEIKRQNVIMTTW